MRYIRKNEPPNLELEPRRQENPPFTWVELEDIDGLKDDVKQALMDEQGYLCAYTGWRIRAETAHVEHMRPRKSPDDYNGEWWERQWETNYTNLVACYPQDGASYGAHKKGNWPGPKDWDQFVSPLELTVGGQFDFFRDGRVKGRTSAAEKTITKLSLNHDILKERRQLFIRRALKPVLEKGNARAKRAALKKLASGFETKNEQDAQGRRLPEFVFVLAGALKHALSNLP